MSTISLSRVTDWAALGERWRELEALSDCSFFQSWTWVGCLAEQRFTDPVLLEAFEENRLVALALFNRRRSRTGREILWLGETGVAELDTVFIEYNGILLANDASDGLLAECLRAARQAPIGQRRQLRRRRLVLSGIASRTLDAAMATDRGSWVQTRPAPYIDLDRVRRDGGDFLAGLSANARYQLRRSDRAYATHGDVAVKRAGSVREAYEFLGALAELHQAAWTSRGRPGSFANSQFVRFHRSLIECGFGRGEIELLRVACGDRPIGLLYNFRFRDSVLAYQSGFDYAGAGKHQKPGLTCHHQAIRLAAGAGMARYDFLAGGDRYKRSLANAEYQLHWAIVGPGWPVRRCIARLPGLAALHGAVRKRLFPKAATAGPLEPP